MEISGSDIKVSKVEVQDIELKVTDEDVKKLLPKNLVRQNVRLRIDGVKHTEANAIRRVASAELPIKYLDMSHDNIVFPDTDDMYIISISDMLVNTLRNIHISQDVPMDAVFKLDVKNNSSSIIEVTTASLTLRDGKKHKYFNETTIITILMGGKRLAIDNLRVAVGDGLENGAHCLAAFCVSQPVGIQMFNPYDKQIGESCFTSDPTSWEISFRTNGTMGGKKILLASCDNIIQRLSAMRNILGQITGTNEEYILRVAGETSTVGQLIMKAMCDMYEELDVCIYKKSDEPRYIEFRIRMPGDVKLQLTNAISYLTNRFTQIKSQIK